MAWLMLLEFQPWGCLVHLMTFFFFPLRVDGDWGVVEEGCGRENIDRA